MKGKRIYKNTAFIIITFSITLNTIKISAIDSDNEIINENIESDNNYISYAEDNGQAETNSTLISTYSTPDYKVPSNNVNSYINLYEETLVLPDKFTIAAYSTDGGGTWNTSNIDNIGNIKNFRSLFNNQLNLVLTDSYNTRTRTPSDNAVVIIYPQITARPATVNMKPNYASVKAPGAWLPTPGGKELLVLLDGYEISQLFIKSLGSAKIENIAQWSPIPATGMPVITYDPDRRSNYFQYYYRQAPKVNTIVGIYIPASKPRSFSVTAQAKAPDYRINNDGTINVRAGTAIIANNKTYVFNEPTRVSVVSLLQAYGGTITVFIAATNSKPASAEQKIDFSMVSMNASVNSANYNGNFASINLWE